MSERLDNITHADLRIDVRRSAALGDAVNQVAVFPAEFSAMAMDFPILFRRPNPTTPYQPLAILGLERDENLFLGDDRWEARTVPAVLRIGPFSLNLSPTGEAETFIDLSHPRVTDRPDAAPVFLPHGGNAPALKDAMDALRIVQDGVEKLPGISSLFETLSLIEPIDLKVEVDEDHVVAFTGYGAITPARIAALSADQLDRLNQAGLLFMAVQAASSLDNMNDLLRRKRHRLRAA